MVAFLWDLAKAAWIIAGLGTLSILGGSWLVRGVLWLRAKRCTPGGH